MSVNAGNIVTVDVREDIRSGREPFQRIMAAVAGLQDGQSLAVVNVFEPLPLYEAMAQRGFDHSTERTPDGDWRVVFFRSEQ